MASHWSFKATIRYHAILGNDGPAFFVSPSTIAPVLIAYNAKVRIVGPRGAREVPVEKFFVIPKTEQEREHDLRPDEFVSHVIVPPAPGVRAAGGVKANQKLLFCRTFVVAARTQGPAALLRGNEFGQAVDRVRVPARSWG